APNPVVPYLAPLVAVVGTAMLTGALTAGAFDPLYGVRVVVAGVVVCRFRRMYAGLGWSGVPWAAIEIGALVFAAWIGLGYAVSHPDEESPIPAGLATLPPVGAAAWLVLRVVGAAP